jgi:hypothetical protein
MICGIALGISESYIENQNTVNNILLILKCYNKLTGKILCNSLNWKFCSFVSLAIQNDNE